MSKVALDKKIENLKKSFEFLNEIFDEMLKARLKSAEGLIDPVEYKEGLDTETSICYESYAEMHEPAIAFYMLKKFDWDIRKVFEKVANPAEQFLQLTDVKELKEDSELYSKWYFEIDKKIVEKIVENSLKILDMG